MDSVVSIWPVVQTPKVLRSDLESSPQAAAALWLGAASWQNVQVATYLPGVKRCSETFFTNDYGADGLTTVLKPDLMMFARQAVSPSLVYLDGIGAKSFDARYASERILT